jgi:hypothetical protein
MRTSVTLRLRCSIASASSSTAASSSSTDPREALLDRRIQLAARRLRAHEHRVDDVLDTGVHRVPEAAQIVLARDRR